MDEHARQQNQLRVVGRGADEVEECTHLDGLHFDDWVE